MPTNRKANHSIQPLLLDRWSPRAMSGEPMTDEELMPLFEAARWAPSAYNNQPWKFLYAKRETEHWETFFNLMVEFNQVWTKNASALVVVLSNSKFEYNGKDNPTHSFDTGSAWENLALEASARGFVAHGMAGFDYDVAREVLEVPEEFAIEAMVAIGKLGKKEDLSEDLQKEEQPSDRRPLEEIVTEGVFQN